MSDEKTVEIYAHDDIDKNRLVDLAASYDKGDLTPEQESAARIALAKAGVPCARKSRETSTEILNLYFPENPADLNFNSNRMAMLKKMKWIDVDLDEVYFPDEGPEELWEVLVQVKSAAMSKAKFYFKGQAVSVESFVGEIKDYMGDGFFRFRRSSRRMAFVFSLLILFLMLFRTGLGIIPALVVMVVGVVAGTAAISSFIRWKFSPFRDLIDLDEGEQDRIWNGFLDDEDYEKVLNFMQKSRMWMGYQTASAQIIKVLMDRLLESGNQPDSDSND